MSNIKYNFTPSFLKALELETNYKYSLNYIYTIIKNSCSGKYKEILPNGISKILFGNNAYNKKIPSKNFLFSIIKKKCIISVDINKQFVILNNSVDIPYIEDITIIL